MIEKIVKTFEGSDLESQLKRILYCCKGFTRILIVEGYFNMYLFILRNLENDPSKRIETAVGVLL